jgi:predicted site-specific integrase-resolvase
MERKARMIVATRLIRLERWLELTYGEDAPDIVTARRWAHAGKIQPPAEKHGRSYFVHPHARYTAGPRRLIDRIRADEAKAVAR